VRELARRLRHTFFTQCLPRHILPARSPLEERLQPAVPASPRARRYARKIHSSIRRLVHRALDAEGMTRADLANMLQVDVQKLSRALDRPEHMTIEGLGRICAALEITLTFSEKHAASRQNLLRNKRLRRGGG